MDYKKIIKKQETRLKILRLLDFLPDKFMIQLQYWIKTGRRLNLKAPKRFSEKLQWYKLYYRDPLMTKCSDKYAVRDYVISKGYEDILVPLYGVYNKPEEIDFDKLPNSFVLKITNGSHTNILCEDKSKLDIEQVKKTLNKWIRNRTVKAGREWAYYNIKPRIICEKYLDKDENNDLIDYKFFCFNGEPFYVLVIKDRYKPSGVKKGFFTTDFSFIPIKNEEYYFLDNDGNRINLSAPENYQEMLVIARKLSKNFPYLRVDLYNIKGKIYFGELTFYDASGYVDYGEFDLILGEKFILPENEK